MTSTSMSTGLIPDRLLANIKKGDCVLFLGADLPLGYPGAPLSRPELAAALAEQYDLPPGQPWPETAQAYLGRFPNDRHGLVSFVLERGSGPQVKPGPLHEAIAQAGFQAIVTSGYDECLEYALRDAGCRVHRVVQDKQLPFVETGEREVIVVKLYGCLSDLESLVLTSWDHDRLLAHLGQKLRFVTSFCTVRPLLFVGHDLRDAALRQLYIHASDDVVEYMRRAYAVWPAPTVDVHAAWQGMNLELLDYQPTAFLQALAAQMPAAAPGARHAVHVHKPPYKFLDYYEAADADIFCGRDTESQIVTRLILSHRLLTLFGPSGAGKTSLLLAGVLPRLGTEDYGHVYVRALDDPLPAVRQAVAARAGRADWQTGADLRAFLAEMLGEKDRLVIVLDQFEELFLRVGTGRREAFFNELAAALTDAEREVRVVFSLREDYWARLDEARAHLPQVFADSFRLTALDRPNARVAITEPAARAGVAIEPALVDALVGVEGREGDAGAGDLVETDDLVSRVPPAALQIVLDRLYRDALPPNHPPGDPPPPGLALTLAAYRAVQHTQQRPGEELRVLTGAAAILAGYVPEGLARLPDRGADPALGREILKALVTSQATKAALTHAEIETLLAEAGALDPADEADRRLAREARLGLERVRLLRGFERGGAALYELTHDYLAAEIATWIGQAEMQTKLARELLRRRVDDWRGAGLLIPRDALGLIHTCCEDLQRLSAAELELLLRSALAVGYEVPYWFDRARAAGVPVDDIALAGLKSDAFRARAAAVAALGQLGDRFVDAIIPTLADAYPQVRLAAIRALERLRPDGAWRTHLKYECYVPAGPFLMGDDQSDQKCEKPAHEVHLEAFYIGRYPVTNAEYRRYKDDVGQPFEIPPGKANHPVVEVSWYDARDYAAWAGLRLLTEAEWEKSASWAEEPGREGAGERSLVGRLLGRGKEARPGQKRQYPWGDEFDKGKCNTDESGIGTTTPVGQYSPAGDSPYGCADMAGNVWEWTSSLKMDYPYRVDDGREGPVSTGFQVLRGGSFNYTARNARCAYRSTIVQLSRWNYYGVRVGVVAAHVFPW